MRMKGIIFDIQHYAIYDGPGIRSLVFFKGCPLRCQWCQNPESQAEQPQMSYFQEKCARCARCVEACPHNALLLTPQGIIRDWNVCKVCGQCARVCPRGAMEKIGRVVSVEEVAAEILGDVPFYESSGGGVTISGGEPTVQLDFLLALLTLLKNHKIHTAIETCGQFHSGLLRQLLPLVDLFLFDLKQASAHLHQEYTGCSNVNLLSNFEKVVAQSGSHKIIARIPLIPRVNAEIKYIEEMLNFLKQVKYRGPVHLLPYNRLSKTKYEKLGLEDCYTDFGILPDETLKDIIHFIEAHQFEVVCNW